MLDFEVTNQAALGLGKEVVSLSISGTQDLGPTFATARQERVDALIILVDALTIGHAGAIMELAAADGLPTVAWLEFARFGSLLSYGVDVDDAFRQGVVRPSHPAGCQPRGSADRATHEAQARRESQNRRGARDRDPSRAPAARRRGDRVRRRDLLLSALPALLARPAGAQQSVRTPVVGVLIPYSSAHGSPGQARLEGLRRGLREHGYDTAKDLVIEPRWL